VDLVCAAPAEAGVVFLSTRLSSVSFTCYGYVHAVRRRVRVSIELPVLPNQLVVVVVVVVVNGSYSAAPYSSPDRECITKVEIKHRQST